MFIVLAALVVLTALMFWSPAVTAQVTALFGPDTSRATALTLIVVANLEAAFMAYLVKGASALYNTFCFLLILSVELGLVVFLMRMFH